ncbi:MAG: winged helix-turn-helix transcriptional regulator [Anaerolineae bacterium]|nr:winged helix-turn-helix transcriptional regulator [Anaerolineae bacterium]
MLKDTTHTQNDLMTLLQLSKALADESRLRILVLLCQAERSVGELAELLDLKEPTISHHLARLRQVGLVNLRAEAPSASTAPMPSA